MMFSTRLGTKLAKAANKFLQHKCTLVSFVEVEDEEDERGNPVYSRLEVLDVSCLLLWQDVERVDERGTTLLRTPLLYVDVTQPVLAGALVENITDRNDIVLLSNAKVTTVNTTAEGGIAILKVCGLEGAVV